MAFSASELSVDVCPGPSDPEPPCRDEEKDTDGNRRRAQHGGRDGGFGDRKKAGQYARESESDQCAVSGPGQGVDADALIPDSIDSGESEHERGGESDRTQEPA